MRIGTVLPASIALLFITTAVLAGQSISSLSVTLRGKNYDVADVTTVKDLQEQVEIQSGVSTKQQGRVIFGGKRLDADTVLSDAGVPVDGGHLNMVPSTSKSSSNKKKTKAASASGSGATASASKAGAAAASNPMAEYLKQSGVDTSELDEMMKKMGDGSGEGMQQGMQAMTEAMKSPLFQQMMSDPERLEQSRQMILNNPMLKSMMAGMPGMEEIINDPDAWREAMQAAAELYKNMDSDELMKAMMGGAGAAGMPGMSGGAGGAGGMEGLFDGTLDDSTAAAALDELDEDD